MINIQVVASKKDQKDFIYLPWKIYKGHSNWVPPIVMDFKKIFSPKHPFYEYGTIAHFIAKKGQEVVGRISAITNSLHEKHQDKSTAFIGFFECIHDQQVANALFDKATHVLKQKGYHNILGPANPSINYEYGLLIDGFDDPPRVMMTYNPPYYMDLIEGYGFKKIKNLFAYRLDVDKAVNHPKLKRVSELITKRYHIKLRPLNLKNLAQDIAIIKDIYTIAWEKNWGDLPMTDLEFEGLAQAFKPLADPNLVQFAYINQRPVGIIVSMPDWYEVFKTMNGKLFPFNFLKLITQKKSHQWARVLLLGVLPEYRGKGIDGLLCYTALKNAQDRGIQYGEGSWILEDNEMMNRAMQNVFGEVYKTYGVYKKSI